MAVTSLSAITVADLKSALTNNNRLGTVYFEDSTNLICSLTGFSKIWRFNFSPSTYVSLYYGDAWSSGTTLTNTKTVLQTYSAYTISAFDLIISNKAIAITIKDSNGYTNCFILAKTSETVPRDIVLGAGSSNNSSMNGSKSYNLTNGLELSMATNVNLPIVDSTGKFYAFDIYLKERLTNILLPFPIDGVKQLGKSIDTSTITGKYGNDAVLPTAYTAGGAVAISSIVILNGNI